MLSTHLPLREIAAEMILSPHTIRTQAKSIYRNSAQPAAAGLLPGPVSSGSSKAEDRRFHYIRAMKSASIQGAMGFCGE